MLSSRTMSSRLLGSPEPREDALPGGTEEDDRVNLRLGAFDLHPRRADRHARNGESLGLRPLRKETFDRRGGHMPLDHIAVDLSGMASGKGLRHPETHLHPVN